MEKKYEIIRDKVIKGTNKAIEKLIIESEKQGKPLIVSNKPQPK